MKIRLKRFQPGYSNYGAEWTENSLQTLWVVQQEHFQTWVTLKSFNKKENAELCLSRLIRKYPKMYEVVDDSP